MQRVMVVVELGDRVHADVRKAFRQRGMKRGVARASLLPFAHIQHRLPPIGSQGLRHPALAVIRPDYQERMVGVLLDRLDASEAFDREPGHPAVQPVIAPGARVRSHHLHAGLAQLVGPVARAGADFYDGGVRGKHLDGRIIQDGKPIMLEIELAQAPGRGRVRRGLPGPQGPVAPLCEKLPGQGHGYVPSIRSAAVVSADARAHVVRGHEAQDELFAPSSAFGAQDEPGARRRDGRHGRIAGDKPLLRIAIGAMRHLRHDGVIEHAPARLWIAHVSAPLLWARPDGAPLHRPRSFGQPGRVGPGQHPHQLTSMVTSMGTSVALPFSFSLRHRLALRLQGRQPAHGGVDRLGIDVSDAQWRSKRNRKSCACRRA
jgi:hypothetical protein